MNKAKSVEENEMVLYNNLNKAILNIDGISKWYDSHDYKLNEHDTTILKNFIIEINNLYQGLNNLLLITENFELSTELNHLVTSKVYNMASLELYLWKKRNNIEDQ